MFPLVRPAVYQTTNIRADTGGFTIRLVTAVTPANAFFAVFKLTDDITGRSLQRTLDAYLAGAGAETNPDARRLATRNDLCERADKL